MVGIVYMEDVERVPEKSEKFVRGADVLIIDAAICNLERDDEKGEVVATGRKIRGHLNTSEALELVKKFKPKVAFLTQLGHTYPSYDETVSLVREYWYQVRGRCESEVHVSHDGLKISLQSGVQDLLGKSCDGLQINLKSKNQVELSSTCDGLEINLKESGESEMRLFELLRDVKNYNPSRLRNDVLRDDFRLLCAYYSSKKQGKKIKLSYEDIINLAKLIYDEIERRKAEGKMKHEWHPEKMKKYAKELYDIVSSNYELSEFGIKPGHKPKNVSSAMKVLIRKLYVDGLSRLRILDLFAGSGAVAHACYDDKTNQIVAVDSDGDKLSHYRVKKAKVSKIHGDNIEFLKNEGDLRYDVIDLDAYGSPTEQIRALFEGPKRFKDNVLLFITDGVIPAIEGAINEPSRLEKIFRRYEAETPRGSLVELIDKLPFIQERMIVKLANKYDLRAKLLCYSFNKSKKTLYTAFELYRSKRKYISYGYINKEIVSEEDAYKLEGMIFIQRDNWCDSLVEVKDGNLQVVKKIKPLKLRFSKRFGFVLNEIPDHQREKIENLDLSMFRDFTVVKDFVSVVGSSVDEQDKEPEDLDLVIRLDPEYSYLKRVIETKLRKLHPKAHPFCEPMGSGDDYLPLYDLVLRRVKNPRLVKMDDVLGNSDNSDSSDNSDNSDNSVNIVNRDNRDNEDNKDNRDNKEEGGKEEEDVIIQKGKIDCKPMNPFYPMKPGKRFYDVDEVAKYVMEKSGGEDNRKVVLAEEKFNGYRGVIHKKGSRVVIYSDQKRDITFPFPSIVEQAKRISDRDFILDGEIVPYDEKGKPLGRNYAARYIGAVKSRRDISDKNVKFHAFDLLYFDDKCLMGLRQYERKKILYDNFKDTENIKIVRAYP
ncbi:MAG: hypothetical protein DRO95_06325, partial [Candidatus Altiarchaeales archaeon]